MWSVRRSLFYCGKHIHSLESITITHTLNNTIIQASAQRSALIFDGTLNMAMLPALPCPTPAQSRLCCECSILPSKSAHSQSNKCATFLLAPCSVQGWFQWNCNPINKSSSAIQISYLNIPIWLTMWSQFPGVCNSSVNKRYNSLHISIIRPTMVRISCFHSSSSPSSLRISDTCLLCQLPECATYSMSAYQACTIQRWVTNLTPLQHR